MANEISTVQSLKAVDAWIDVINANINGGVRTAFKSSRLKFGGTNVNVVRAGNSTALPLQMPEPGLMTANTVIDFSQGAITTSTENAHLAIQGEGFFMLASPDCINITGNAGTQYSASARFFLSRDGEFYTDSLGYLRSSATGYYLVCPHLTGGVPALSTTVFGNAMSQMRPIINDIDGTPAATANNSHAMRLSDFITGNIDRTYGGFSWAPTQFPSLVQVQGKQSLQYSQFGSTVYDFGFQLSGGAALGTVDPSIAMTVNSTPATILGKSLEASNASMTQSVPELSLAQKLFSALTKVLQISQTNTDAVLNLVR